MPARSISRSRIWTAGAKCMRRFPRISLKRCQGTRSSSMTGARGSPSILPRLRSRRGRLSRAPSRPRSGHLDPGGRDARRKAPAGPKRAGPYVTPLRLIASSLPGSRFAAHPRSQQAPAFATIPDNASGISGMTWSDSSLRHFTCFRVHKYVIMKVDGMPHPPSKGPRHDRRKRRGPAGAVPLVGG